MNPDHTDTSSSTTPPPLTPQSAPDPKRLNAALRETNNVMELTSLNANAGQPSRLANLTYSNTVRSRNLSTQNAVAHQQALSHLNLSTVGKTVGTLTNLHPREARASVDILTDNATADEIAKLRAVTQSFSGGRGSGRGGANPINPGRLTKGIRTLLKAFTEIVARNERLQGSGTLDDPYVITDGGAVYVSGPMMLAFVGVTPAQLKIGRPTHGQAVSIST